MDLRHYAYVQARLQARNGDRPDAKTWAQLEPIQDPARFLDVARTTPLRPWVLPLRADMDVHTVEGLLRAQLRDYVDIIARLHPAPWRPALYWTQRLLELPAIQHLINGGEPLPWMQEDEALRECAQARPEERARVLAQSPDCAPLAGAARAGVPLRQAWRRHWQDLWPADRRAHLAALARLVRDIEQVLPPLPDERAETLNAVCEQFGRRLEHAFRRDMFQPAAGLIHIGLVALDVLRLRGMLLPRMVFASGREAA